MNRLLSIILILLSAFVIPRINLIPQTTIAGVKTEEEILRAPQPIRTESRFHTKLETQEEKLERKTVYKDDPETEAGEEKVLEEGSDGKKTRVLKITFYEGKEYSRETVSTEIQEPKDKVIMRGSKIVWRTVEGSDGSIRYWKKLRVWATHYDSHCLGCDDYTAIGMRAGKGVIAVDPKVIKLHTKVYVPGYGLAIAGDTGGAIKGNIIDLGFEDAKTAGWRARFVDIYILD